MPSGAAPFLCVRARRESTAKFPGEWGRVEEGGRGWKGEREGERERERVKERSESTAAFPAEWGRVEEGGRG